MGKAAPLQCVTRLASAVRVRRSQKSKRGRDGRAAVRNAAVSAAPAENSRGWPGAPMAPRRRPPWRHTWAALLCAASPGQTCSAAAAQQSQVVGHVSAWAS